MNLLGSFTRALALAAVIGAGATLPAMAGQA